MKTHNKLSQFLAKHQSFISDFEVTSILTKQNISTESKYALLKNTLNLDNHFLVKPQCENNVSKISDDLPHETEEMYFRQLNRMYEGQDQFEACKMEEKNKLKENKKENRQSGLVKKTIYSEHFERKSNSVGNLIKFKYEDKVLKNDFMKKYIVAPDFTKMLTDSSPGFARKSSEALLNRKLRKFRRNINGCYAFSKSKEFNLESDLNKKTIKLKKEIKHLEEKAKKDFNLDFEEHELDNTTEKELKLFSNQNEQKLETTKLKHIGSVYEKLSYEQINNKNNNFIYNSNIPNYLLKNKEKIRPASVLTTCISFRLKTGKNEKFCYLRV